MSRIKINTASPLAALALLAILGLGLAACDEGPAEEAGRETGAAIDDAAETVGGAIEDAGESLQRATD